MGHNSRAGREAPLEASRSHIEEGGSGPVWADTAADVNGLFGDMVASLAQAPPEGSGRVAGGRRRLGTEAECLPCG